MRLRALAVLLAVAFPVHAADPKQLEADYHAMQKWRFSAQAIPLTTPVTITRDVATFTLQSGSVRPMEPLSSGRVTGLVFEGEGRFAMTVPDRTELVQLRRFMEQPNLTSFDERVTELVLRVSDDTIEKLFPGVGKPPFETNALAEKRHNSWLIDLRSDTDARIVAAMANPGALQMTAAFRSPGSEWLTWDYDSSRREEIQLIRVNPIYPEVWLSIDRAEDRDAAGRPGERDPRPARLEHIDVDADLSKLRFLAERAGRTQQLMLNGHYAVDETVVPLADGVTALRFDLSDEAHDVAASDDSGPLVVLRDHLGARTSQIENKVYDGTMTLLFPQPLKRGEAHHVRFTYVLETANYGLGNTWYPTVSGSGIDDWTTGRLKLKVAKRNQVRAMGTKQSETETADGKVSVWVIDSPAKMITFSTAERFEEVPLEVPDVPKVISFGTVSGFGQNARVRNAGADVANSLGFFQFLLDDKLGVPQIYVTSIAGGHGQAFDGFLHLSDFTYEEHPGASELFRAHEVAHEWFGHKIGWKSYRDQWLSESFAEYLAMMFVEATVKGGPKYYDEIITSYDGVVQGNYAGGFSKFARPWLVERNSSLRARLGPIATGYRAGTKEVPYGYLVQAYHKGPLVLHMLRMMLRAKTHKDDLFVKILRDFVKEYSGKSASTADFQRIVERDAPGDWRYFFDAWVYGAEIPTYTWHYKVEPSAAGARLTMTVKRSDAGNDFVMVALVRVEFDGGRAGTFFIPLNQTETNVTRDLPAVPRSVIFAPDHSLLAKIRRE